MVQGESCELEVTIRNKQGLHARPAAQFVRIATKYRDAEVNVSRGTLSVNGKSIIGIMMLAAGPGSTLTIRATGEGSDAAVKELRELVDAGFGEEMAE